jgi:Tol biopolymer transport system component
LYYRTPAGNNENAGIYLGSLDVTPESQSSVRLIASDSAARYAPATDSSTGHILFEREGSLMAQPFDESRMELVGDPVPIAEGLVQNAAPVFSVSATGVLAYVKGDGSGGGRNLTWFDRAGKLLKTEGPPGDYNTVSLSPDDTRVAVSRLGGTNTDIWIHEFAQGNPTRFTFDPGVDWLAVWSRDASRIMFSSERGGPHNLYRKASNGAGTEETVFKSNEPKYVQDWSADGKFLLYSQNNGIKGSLDLWFLSPDGEPKPQAYLATEFIESQGRFSPDGRFVAYSSNASGRSEVYVQPFPNASEGKWMVSTEGGTSPRWRRDGKELFYIASDSRLMSVEVSTAPTFTKGVPKALFVAPIFGGGSTQNVTRYDVTRDGKRFLINAERSQIGADRVTPITVILNWPALLRR